MSASVPSQQQTMPPGQLASDAKNAPTRERKRAEYDAARERKRAEYEANTIARKCLGCGGEFRSEGSHNRLCTRCRSRR